MLYVASKSLNRNLLHLDLIYRSAGLYNIHNANSIGFIQKWLVFKCFRSYSCTTVIIADTMDDMAIVGINGNNNEILLTAVRIYASMIK